MPVHESEVLKPHDPAITDDNEWPEFVLSNAEVRDVETNAISTLLHADTLTPVNVTGRLEPVDADLAHLLINSQPRGTQLVVRNVTRFAYGQYEDGEVAIWAAGEAGWYKIKPSRSFRSIFEGMVDAIDVLYYLADVYREGDLDGSAKGIFNRLAKERPEKYQNARAAKQMIYGHREFLILSMLTGKELDDPPWIYTDIFLHLKAEFPDDYADMVRKKAGKKRIERKQRAKSSSQTKTAAAAQDVEMANAPAARKESARPTPISSAPSKKDGPPKKDNNWWETKVLWELVQKANDQGILPHDDLSIDNSAKVMVRRYEVDDEAVAADYFRAHASNLMWMMANKRKSAVAWTETVLYTELSTARLAPAALKRASELKVRRRRDPLPDPAPNLQATTGTGIESSSEEDIAEVRRRARKGRSSILRPKSSANYSGKGASGGKSHHRSSGEENGGDSDDAGLLSPNKRKSQNDWETSQRKRSQVRTAQGLSPPESDQEDSKEKLPLRWKTPVANRSSRASTPLGSFLPSLKSEAPPSVEANSPGDIWRCTVDGCVHKVYGASTEPSQAMIAEHLDQHDNKRKEAIDLVKSEELRSNLPVTNLIKRIREMADSQQSMLQLGLGGSSNGAGGPSAPSSLPQPIQRHF
ncbi:hypothetical protein IWZ00DRAFT_312089 [Phyllosticta capitalensis]